MIILMDAAQGQDLIYNTLPLGTTRIPPFITITLTTTNTFGEPSNSPLLGRVLVLRMEEVSREASSFCNSSFSLISRQRAREGRPTHRPINFT